MEQVISRTFQNHTSSLCFSADACLFGVGEAFVALEFLTAFEAFEVTFFVMVPPSVLPVDSAVILLGLSQYCRPEKE